MFFIDRRLYWKSNRNIDINKQPTIDIELDCWHRRGYGYEILIAACTDEEYMEIKLQKKKKKRCWPSLNSLACSMTIVFDIAWLRYCNHSTHARMYWIVAACIGLVYKWFFAIACPWYWIWHYVRCYRHIGSMIIFYDITSVKFRMDVHCNIIYIP